MPQFKTGDIWTVPKNEWIVITTNSFVKKDGSLVMGRGVAKEALEKDPMLDKLLGGFVKQTCGHLGFYGCAIIAKYKMAALQTKFHYSNKSSIELINRSIKRLRGSILPFERVNMVFPGIGYGQLSARDVYLSCLKDLPGYYTIWSKDLFVI